MDTKQRIQEGDFIFYRNPEGAHEPHEVREVRHRGVSRGGRWIRLEDGRWVKVSNCQLQSEWAKENEQ